MFPDDERALHVNTADTSGKITMETAAAVTRLPGREGEKDKMGVSRN